MQIRNMFTKQSMIAKVSTKVQVEANETGILDIVLLTR